MTSPERHRYAVVGTGHRAELYVAALVGSHADVGRPVALCDPSPTRMAYYQDLVRAAGSTPDPLPAYAPAAFDEMLVRERPDTVLVTSVDSTHADYIARALRHGCDVVSEKPMTTDVAGCRTIADAVASSPSELVVTFNYRYSPRNSVVKELVRDGRVGAVTSVHFEWMLDTVHGADYFRRWHRDKAASGGLLVHKATHHFDLVNWWLDDIAETVFAFAGLRFYGERNASERGLRPRARRSHDDPGVASDPFGLDLASNPRLRRLYLDAEADDGYVRDLDVFGEGISTEDTLAVTARYARGALLTYSLTAYSPWEGYRVAITGTEGRLELDVVERAYLPRRGAGDVVGRSARPAVDPSAAPAVDPSAAPGAHPESAAPATGPRTEGSRLVLQRHWEPARRVEIPDEGGAHGGGDSRLLDDLFRRDGGRDPLGRAAGYRDGVRSVLVGVAANTSVATAAPIRLADLGVPLDHPEPVT